MKSKLSLNELKIKSFITSVGEKDKVKSGVNTIFHACALTGEFCFDTENPAVCPPTMEPPKRTHWTCLSIDNQTNCGPHIVTENGHHCV